MMIIPQDLKIERIIFRNFSYFIQFIRRAFIRTVQIICNYEIFKIINLNL